MTADVPGWSFVPITAGRLCAVNAGAPFDHVEVKLQNAAFAEDEFGDRDQGGFRALAEERAAGSEEQVFYELLCDGGGSASAVAFQILLGGDLDFVPIEAMVLVEACILGGDDSVLEIGRDLAERNEFVALAIGPVVNPGLKAALEVHGGCGWVDPAGSNQEQSRKGP